MLRVALRTSAARGALFPSLFMPSGLWFKPLCNRAGHRATPSHALTSLTPIKTTSSAQWPTSRVLRPRFFSTNNGFTTHRSLPVLPPRSVGIWLMVSSTLVFAIIVVGGITRLTESGLSITEWRPVSGILPPLTHEEWVLEFDKYKNTPEFKMYVFARNFMKTELMLHLGLIPLLRLMISNSFIAWSGVIVS